MKIVFETPKAKVIKIGNSYEVHTISTRNLDGIVDTNWELNMAYGDWYCRDWMGKTYEYNKLHDPYLDAIKYAQHI